MKLRKSELLQDPINEPINHLLMRLSEKYSLKIANELFARFSSQEWSVQIKILGALLDTGKNQCIDWVFQHMTISRWDWLNRIIKKYDDDSAKRLRFRIEKFCDDNVNIYSVAYFAVEKMPIGFIRKHIKQLNRILQYNYYELALRMAVDKNWPIEKNRLISKLLYYSILAKHRRAVDPTEARTDFINYLLYKEKQIRLDDSPVLQTFVFEMSLMHCRDIKYWIDDIESLGLYELADGIREWDRSLQSRIMEIHRLFEEAHPFPEIFYERLAFYWDIFISMAVNDIKTSMYSDHALERIIADNKDLMELIHKFNLQIVSPITF